MCATRRFCFHAKRGYPLKTPVRKKQKRLALTRKQKRDQVTGLAGGVAGRVAPPRTYSRMLTISVQIAIARKPKNPTGVTATTPIRIAIQPSHAGSTP